MGEARRRNAAQHQAQVAEIGEVVERIRPLLAGRHPGVQMGVVADLAALWIAGHHEGLRGEMREMLGRQIDELVPANAALIRGGR